jgi:hypothetical protein
MSLQKQSVWQNNPLFAGRGTLNHCCPDLEEEDVQKFFTETVGCGRVCNHHVCTFHGIAATSET